MSLLLALHAEHKQRTGHDCTKNPPHQMIANIMCDVCLNLRAEFRELEKAEADHYERQSKEAANMTGFQFVKLFCANMGCVPADEVTRIEFRYVVEKPQCCCGAWEDPPEDYPGAWERSEDWCPVHSQLGKD